MSSPGAYTSNSSPTELIELTIALLFVAPTAKTSSYAAGYSIALSESPLLPADAIIKIPASLAAFIAFSKASDLFTVPKLIFIISTFSSIHLYIPCIILLTGASLFSSNTLIEYNSTFGAIPFIPFISFPAIILAIPVPCPDTSSNKASTFSCSGIKFILLYTSMYSVADTPESISATLTFSGFSVFSIAAAFAFVAFIASRFH